ncbi:MAG: hypothetical protein ACKPKO_61095 [Candidatus Fonsibacter sp.]
MSIRISLCSVDHHRHHHCHHYHICRQLGLGHACKRKQRVVGTGELAKLEAAWETWLTAMPMSETSASNVSSSSSPLAEPVSLPMPSLTPQSPRQRLIILDHPRLRLSGPACTQGIMAE